MNKMSMMAAALILAGCACESFKGTRATPVAGGDSGAKLQALFDDAKISELRLGAGEWVIEKPLFVRHSNLTLILEDGCHLIAKKGGFKDVNDSLLSVGTHNGKGWVENIKIIGEGKAVLEMQMKDYQNPDLYTLGEWRHTLATWNAKNVLVQNLTVTKNGGDGIYVNGSQNVELIDIDAVDCHRLGFGIIDVVGLHMLRCKGRETRGTPPKCGIDFEPNHIENRLNDILVEDCVFENNDSAGVLMHLCQMTEKTVPIDITFRNCVCRNNWGVENTIHGASDKGVVGGKVVFDNCRTENTRFKDFEYLDQDLKNGVKVEFVNNCLPNRGGTIWVPSLGVAPLLLNKYAPAFCSDPKKPLSTGWLRESGTFLQYCPKAGTYRVTMKCTPLGRNPLYFDVRQLDALGTDLGVTRVEKTRDFEFTMTGPGWRQFVVRGSGLFNFVSAHGGAGLKTSKGVHLYSGKKRAFAFEVPAGKNAAIEITPQEPVSATIYDASGKQVEQKPFDGVKKVMSMKRAANAPVERWRVVFDEVGEDAFFRIATPCPPIAYLAE